MSLTALGANLVAIPLVSVGILPISLLLVVAWPDLAYSVLLFVHDGLYTLLFTLLTRQGVDGLFSPTHRGLLVSCGEDLLPGVFIGGANFLSVLAQWSSVY